jgi:hypothetical protein
LFFLKKEKYDAGTIIIFFMLLFDIVMVFDVVGLDSGFEISYATVIFAAFIFFSGTKIFL